MTTTEYRDHHTFHAWAKARLVVDKASRVTNAVLYADYADWCAKHAEHTCSHRGLTCYMKRAMPETVYRWKVASGRLWIGIRLRTAADDAL